MEATKNKIQSRNVFSYGLTIPVIIAVFEIMVQTLFHGRYGYFRDELYYIACTKHLDLGYVDHPPLSIFLLWINRHLLGDSLYAMRLLPSLAGASVIILAALTARKLGGGRFCQSLAALSVAAAPGLAGMAQLFTMNPFDVFFWTLTGYILVCLFVDNKPKLWIYFGLVIGLGLLNKYSIGFMVIGLITGMLFTHQRKHFASLWFWSGAAIAALIFFPHVLWQISHSFPSLEFMRNASMNKNVHLGPIKLFLGQVQDINFFNTPLWLGGIYFFYKHNKSSLRPLAWIYPIVFLIMVFSNGKVYYLAASYPLYLAGGAVLFEQIIPSIHLKWAKPAFISSLMIYGLISVPFTMPVLPIEQFIKYQSLVGTAPRADERSGVAELPQYFADQFGWKELVSKVAGAYRKLSKEEQAQCLIYMRNYGQAGAIEFFGKDYGLPNVVCPHNSYWLWGPGNRTGNIAIIIGPANSLNENLADLHKYYKYVEFADITNAKYTMPFERGRMIFICKGMNTTFQKIWSNERFYI
ncbi:MAG: glycosyltransferase family 39 protein [Clostridiales bacterium]